MTGRLVGKTALITGSDSGIGQATAIEFGREGADVVVHYLHDHAGANYTKAPFNQRAIDDPKYLEEQVQSIPWKRAAKPEEIAKVAVFLASHDADYVTGSTYFIDGGLMQNQGQGA